jgi:dihydrodipicolinate synthase/N-acetylneuraminate lyase
MLDPLSRLRPRRKIEGLSAILLPFTPNGDIDWLAFDAHVARTCTAGLAPAVNMDTGYANLIDEPTRQTVLARTQAICAGRPFVAGAYVGDQPGAQFNADAYARQIASITAHAGTPVIFQSYGLTALTGADLIAAYAQLGQYCARFIAFELGTLFAPFGKIYTLDEYVGLMSVPQCIGAKHSSLSRALEWQRLELRDSTRPDFRVYTGNDLAIDMVMYGSDYLLGLSTFAPDLFAQRDAYWLAGDARFYELNDALQYLGCFAFRQPVPAYKHTAAQFLHLRGWLSSDRTHPHSPTRPASDVPILRDIGRMLGVEMMQ